MEGGREGGREGGKRTEVKLVEVQRGEASEANSEVKREANSKSERGREAREWSDTYNQSVSASTSTKQTKQATINSVPNLTFRKAARSPCPASSAALAHAVNSSALHVTPAVSTSQTTASARP